MEWLVDLTVLLKGKKKYDNDDKIKLGNGIQKSKMSLLTLSDPHNDTSQVWVVAGSTEEKHIMYRIKATQHKFKDCALLPLKDHL